MWIAADITTIHSRDSAPMYWSRNAGRAMSGHSMFVSPPSCLMVAVLFPVDGWAIDCELASQFGERPAPRFPTWAQLQAMVVE